MNNKKIKIYILKYIRIILYIYILIIIVIFINQKSMLYFPNKKDFYTCNIFDKNEMKTFNGTRFYEKKGKNNNIIIYFHGNAGNACNRESVKEILEKTDSNYIFVEYTGYAEEKNEPNIKDILNDADNIGKYIKSKNYENIGVLGISLGTGIASYYASKYDVENLLLISPYSELSNVAKDKYPIFPVKYIFTENYNSIKYLKNYNKNLLIIHGEKDDVIPIKFGEELYKSINTKNKKIIELENGTHHNIIGNIENNNIILEFLNNNKNLGIN